MNNIDTEPTKPVEIIVKQVQLSLPMQQLNISKMITIGEHSSVNNKIATIFTLATEFCHTYFQQILNILFSVFMLHVLSSI
jgi:hypothetical protein